MKYLLFALCLLTVISPAPAAGQFLIIGDSLSKEYEYEGPGIGIDGVPSPYPKNWCELLYKLRDEFFDFGDRDFHLDVRVLSHDYNWSIPGSFAAEWRERYLANPPGALVSQLNGTAVRRCVIWLGGNDVRDSYGPLYNGETAPAAWAAQTYADIAFVLDWLLARRQPGVQVVLVNVAHLGATPKKNADHPYDPVKTGRVTTALDDLNAQLADLARIRGVGFADIYRMTKELVTTSQWCIGGWMIYKKSSSDGDTDAMFLGDGFHPNMPVQAIFAQAILDAFNSRYDTGIPRLTNREIVDKCLEENPDVAFSQWTANYGIPAADRSAESDADKDGLPNIVEFGVDLDPVRADTNLLPQPRVITQSGQPFLTLMWQPRDPSNTARCEITPQQSTDLLTWTNVPAASIASGSPNLRTASGPAGLQRSAWLRLKIRQTAP